MSQQLRKGAGLCYSYCARGLLRPRSQTKRPLGKAQPYTGRLLEKMENSFLIKVIAAGGISLKINFIRYKQD